MRTFHGMALKSVTEEPKKASQSFSDRNKPISAARPPSGGQKRGQRIFFSSPCTLMLVLWFACITRYSYTCRCTGLCDYGTGVNNTYCNFLYHRFKNTNYYHPSSYDITDYNAKRQRYSSRFKVSFINFCLMLCCVYDRLVFVVGDAKLSIYVRV